MYGLEDFKDLQGNNVNDFLMSYRDAMKQNYDANVAQIEQQRRNDYGSIMSQANKRGMMYSNFPERSKMQYDAETYLPNLAGAYKNYQTGLDKLRSSAISSYNAIRETQDQINHLKEMGDIANGTNSSKLKWGALGIGGKKGWFYGDLGEDGKRKAVRFSTFARHNDFDNTTEGYLNAAKQFLTEDQYKRLAHIVDMQKNTKTPNLGYNAGGFGQTFQDIDYGTRFSPEDVDFLNQLGLTFI